MIIRRQFAGALVLAPSMVSLALAQGSSSRRIGLLGIDLPSNATQASGIATFRAALREYGYSSERELVIIERLGRGPYEELTRLAAELISLNVDAIVCFGTPATEVAKKGKHSASRFRRRSSSARTR